MNKLFTQEKKRVLSQFFDTTTFKTESMFKIEASLNIYITFKSELSYCDYRFRMPSSSPHTRLTPQR